MFVTLWYPVGETSAELIRAADRRKPMLLNDLRTLLTVQSRELFSLPVAQNWAPAVEPVGEKLSTWEDGGKQCCAYETEQNWVLTRHNDALNRLHVTHSNWILLERFLSETQLLSIPEEVVELIERKAVGRCGSLEQSDHYFDLTKGQIAPHNI